MGGKATNGVKPSGNRIEVRFYCQGKQRSPTLDLSPTAANLKHAGRLRIEILRQIEIGDFSFFAAHFPDYEFGATLVPSREADMRNFGDWVLKWEDYSLRKHKHSTHEIYKRHMLCYWTRVFGHLMPAQITNEMLLDRLSELSKPHRSKDNGKLVKGLSAKTQNNILILVRAVFKLIGKVPGNKVINPNEGIENLPVQEPQPDPFDADEVELILNKMRDKKGEAWADYFEFSFFSGLRASEQIQLQWMDVDIRKMKIRVHEALVMGEVSGTTKTYKARQVELNSRAFGVIQRQRARTQIADEHVFLNPTTGEVFADSSVAQGLVWRPLLRSAGVRYRAPKECRDTSVSLALAAGCDPYWVAKNHGHSLQTMLRAYAAFIPDADKGRNIAAMNLALGVQARDQETQTEGFSQ